MAGQIRKGAYFDSVTLMRVGKEITALPGIIDAAVVMGTKSNKAILNSSGLLTVKFIDAGDTDLLVAAARHPRFQPTPESRQKVGDLSLAAQVRAALATDSGTRNLSLEVFAQAGHVVLKGVVFSPAMMDAAADVAKRVPGVSSVSSEAVEIPRIYPGPIM